MELDYDVEAMRKLIDQAKGISMAGMGPRPRATRASTCPFPACGYWDNRPSMTNWVEHFHQRHPGFEDAIRGFSDEVRISDYTGMTVVDHPAQLQITTRPLYMAFSQDGGRKEMPTQRARFMALGGLNIVNTTEITTVIPWGGGGTITHFAIFDAPDMGLNVSGWRPMVHGPITSAPNDTILISCGALTVGGINLFGYTSTADFPDATAEYMAERLAESVTGQVPLNNVYVPVDTRIKINDMNYAVAIHPWFGWIVTVTRQAGGHQRFWRLTRKSADSTGYRYLMSQVKRRERIDASRNPRVLKYSDIRGTSNDPKALTAWEEEFNASA